MIKAATCKTAATPSPVERTIHLIMMLLALWISGGWLFPDSHAQSMPPREYNVPFQLGAGWEGYDQKCSNCHGTWANGSDSGPPLLHSYYLPGHHDDMSFYNAIMNGVRAHHWSFGNMPPVSGVSRERARQIVAFVRWLQKENGLLH